MKESSVTPDLGREGTQVTSKQLYGDLMFTLRNDTIWIHPRRRTSNPPNSLVVKIRKFVTASRT